MDSLWPSLAAELKKELPAQQFDTWIKPLRAERREGQLLLVAPNHHVMRWIRANLLAKIESRVERAGAGRLSVSLILDEKPIEQEIVVPDPVPVASAERAPRGAVVGRKNHCGSRSIAQHPRRGRVLYALRDRALAGVDPRA